jgi:carbamate kinase
MMLSLSTKFQTLGCRYARPIMSAVSARLASTLAAVDNITAAMNGQQPKPQHIVVALGGNALLRRGQQMTQENQMLNIQTGIASRNNKITLVHGNGPQVGLLLLESAEYQSKTGLKSMSLDVLDAETEGMIGYMIEQELQKYIPDGRGMVTILSQIVVDPNDPSMLNPTKFVGPIYTKEEAETLGLPVKKDGDHYRRVVPSPLPIKLVDHQMEAVRTLTESNCLVICAGGGGIPVVEEEDDADDDGRQQQQRQRQYKGVEAVIDKDRAATMMGIALQADGLLILTDVPNVSIDFNTPNEKHIRKVSPSTLQGLMKHFPPGSMGPKIESAIEFVTKTGGWAAIGSLSEAESILQGASGTTVVMAEGNSGADGVDHIEFYDEDDDDNNNADDAELSVATNRRNAWEHEHGLGHASFFR